MHTSDIINYLNHLLKIDYNTVESLFYKRSLASHQIIESDLVYVSLDEDIPKVNTIGVLNGMLSFYAEKKIMAEVDEESGKIVRFSC